MLDAATLSAAIRAKLVLRSWANDSTELTELCDDIAAALIDHITSSAVVVVNPLGLTAPSGAVTGSCTGSVT